MDEEIRKILNKVFTVEEGRIVETMLDVIEKDMSENGRIKRMNQIDSILMEVLK